MQYLELHYVKQSDLLQEYGLISNLHRLVKDEFLVMKVHRGWKKESNSVMLDLEVQDSSNQ